MPQKGACQDENLHFRVRSSEAHCYTNFTCPNGIERYNFLWPCCALWLICRISHFKELYYIHWAFLVFTCDKPVFNHVNAIAQCPTGTVGVSDSTISCNRSTQTSVAVCHVMILWNYHETGLQWLNSYYSVLLCLFLCGCEHAIEDEVQVAWFTCTIIILCSETDTQQ